MPELIENITEYDILLGLHKGDSLAAFGLSKAVKCFVAAQAAAGRRVLYITPDLIAAKDYAGYIAEYLGEESVLYLPPADELLMYKKAENAAAAHRRSAALYRTLKGVPVIVTASETLSQYLPPPDIFGSQIKTLAAGDIITLDELTEYLVSAGFSRESLVSAPGEFSVRGDIVDIFSVNYPYPLRFDFFGDAIESIRFFDIGTQTSKQTVLSADIIPAAFSEYTENGGSVYDYLRADTLIIYDEPKLIEQRKMKLLPGVDDFARIGFSYIAGATNFFSPRNILSFQSTPVANYSHNFEGLAADIRNWSRAGYTVFCMAGSAENAAALKKRLYDFDIFENKNLVISEKRISGGLIAHKNKTVIIGTLELFKTAPKKAVAHRGDTLSEFKAGDYIVHDSFGIGQCAGIQKLKSVSEKDYIVINYKAGDVLYVPVEQSNLLHRYSGSMPPKINRIGGGEFERLKERVKSGIKRMSFDLAELYKKREAGRGFVYSADNSLMTDFEDAFPHAETEDQLRAASEIKADMEKGVIMDRLLSGDVGYGKTEVALRAAFKAVVDGKQVALLCPTTVLCRQHYNTCLERFKDFGVRIDFLSRFKSDKEQAATLKKLADGEIDIVVGTHRLLSKDIKFFDLGLLILDEEQRFGVEDKDRIKTLKTNINVLTLSATPIPRTLHMSLSGIRDISLIETPPVERLTVETYVAEFSESLAADAIRREIARGGQVFFVYNRVKSIYSFAEKIQKLVPEARIKVAHGQMDEAELESAIIDFYDYNSDVLISTTIIENGIDLRRANTLIVAEADRLGLAQLYQLRGRVGRGNRLAYAYFLYDGQKMLTETAYKRLAAIMEFTEFNSGFKLAMRDLEIRGAGDILGREQHGHMDTVGYDMYCRLLSESISELRGKAEKARVEPLIDADIDAFILDSYIEEQIRFKVYRRIAAIKEVAEREKVFEELRDIYGEPPEAVKNLVNIAVVKMLAAKINATKVVVKKGKLEIHFGGIDSLNNIPLLEAVKKYEKICGIDVSVPKISINNKNVSIEKSLAFLEKFLTQASKEV